MNNWYEELVKECKTTHDKECEYGEECPERTSHIERVFVRHALKDRAVTLQARLAAVEKLHGKYPIYDAAFACADRTERHSQEAHMEVDGIIVCTDLPLYVVCAQCRDEEGFHTINWPCDLIKAARGE